MREQVWLIEARFKSVGGPWIPQAMEPFMESADAEAKVDQLRQRNTLSEWRTRRYGAEPSPEPEAAPASEAKAPVVLDDPIDHRRNCPAWTNAEGYEVNGEDCTCGKRWRIDIQTLHELKAAWEKRAYESEAEVASLREQLAQLRARVAILDAQEVKLPDLEPNEEECHLAKEAFPSPSVTAQMVLDSYLRCRERQLLDALRAVQAQRTIMRDLRNGLVAARDFIDSGNSGWFPQQWRDAIAAYDALAGRDGE